MWIVALANASAATRGNDPKALANASAATPARQAAENILAGLVRSRVTTLEATTVTDALKAGVGCPCSCKRWGMKGGVAGREP